MSKELPEPAYPKIRKDGVIIPPVRTPEQDRDHDDIARRNQEAADASASRHGWYHNWALHDPDTTIHWFREDPNDRHNGFCWHGPYETFTKAKQAAIELCRWEIKAAQFQIQNIKDCRKGDVA